MAFVCPGHPLLDAVIDLTLERNLDLLKRGAVLVDERDTGTQPHVVFYMEHAIQDAGLTRSGERRVVSRRMLYVEQDAAGANAPGSTVNWSSKPRAMRSPMWCRRTLLKYAATSSNSLPKPKPPLKTG